MTPPYGECVLLVSQSPSAASIPAHHHNHRHWSTISDIIGISVMKDGESGGGVAGLKKDDPSASITADSLVEALTKLNFANAPKKASFLENSGGKKKSSVGVILHGLSRNDKKNGQTGPEIISRSPPKRNSDPTSAAEKTDKSDEEKKKSDDSSSSSKMTNGTTPIVAPLGGTKDSKILPTPNNNKFYSEGINPKIKQTPADFLKSSSQKSRIAARRTTNSSLEGAVPRETVTSDLRGSTSTGSAVVHPRDNKKVEDIDKEFGALSLKSALTDGERIQRSPVSVFQQHNRHLVTPYSQQSPSSSSRLAAIAAAHQQQQQAGSHVIQFSDGQLTNQQQFLYYQQQQQQAAYLNSLQQQQNYESACAGHFQPQQVTSPGCCGYTLVTTPDESCRYSSSLTDSSNSNDTTAFDLLTPSSVAYTNFASGQQQQQFTKPLTSGQQPSLTDVSSDQYDSDVSNSETRASCAFSSLGAGQRFTRTDFDDKAVVDNKNLATQQQQQLRQNNKKITCNNNKNSNNLNLNINHHNLDQLAAELPDQLSDFILKYSRRYFEGEGEESMRKLSRDESESEGMSPACVSPIEAGSVPQNSPAVPNNAIHQNQSSSLLTPTTSPTKSNSNNNSRGLQTHHVIPDTGICSTEAYVPIQNKQKQQQQQASPESPQRTHQPGQNKQKLRQMIADDDFSNAWAWAVRRSQELPGGLYFRDSDGDSSLHIVIWHKDIPKIYSLTELMNRAGGNQSFPKPFDLPNKLNETPLFLAVEKRLKEVVAYGLENSENPNISARDNESRDRGAPLHFAAERGMTEIVEVLCDCPLIDLNLLNGIGLTPLLCAVKNHRHTTEEESQQFQCLINNKPVIRALLKAGADPKLTDIETGKTVFHYAVECMDPDLLQMFRDHMDKETVHNLVNKQCLQGYTPMDLLTRIVSSRGCNYYATEEGQTFRLKMYKTLVEIGAEMPKFTCGAESPDYVYTFDATYFP